MGNPAGVVILNKWLSKDKMQIIAKENNLSETAFCVKGEINEIRWFTPTCEVDLCGHATLATAFILSQFHYKSCKEFKFNSKRGDLTVKVITENKNGKIFQLNFPKNISEKIYQKGVLINQKYLELIEQVKSLVINSLQNCTQNNINDIIEAVYIGCDVIVILKSKKYITNFYPSVQKISELEEGEGLIITAADGEEFDIVSRCFYPKEGIDEDPVTGSAHCTLFPIWQEVLKKEQIVAYQASNRGGILLCEAEGERVLISGEATLSYR